MALPLGAPPTACGNIVPQHTSVDNMASGPVPFEVDISSIGSSYVPNYNYTSKYYGFVCLFIKFYSILLLKKRSREKL